jgi:AbrB family looped-hinge helix DNA binding protein
MTTRLSSKGQIVLPAAFRRKLALHPGDAIEMKMITDEGKESILLRPKPKKRPKMRIVEDPKTGWPVLKGPPGTPKLTTEMVKEMLADFP